MQFDTEAVKELFKKAYEILESPKKRRDLEVITREMRRTVRPEHGNDSEALKTHQNTIQLRDRITTILTNHFLEVAEVEGFNYIVDIPRLSRGQVDKHLQKWNEEWQTVVKPELQALEKELLS